MYHPISSSEYLLHVLKSGKTNPFVKRSLTDFHAGYYEAKKTGIKVMWSDGGGFLL